MKPEKLFGSVITSYSIHYTKLYDEVIIDFSESASFEEVRLLTVAGQLISSYPIKNGEKSIQVNVSGLTNGMYLLQVVGDVLQTQVLIKE